MNNDCSCPKKSCERHGDCQKCEAYHQEKNNLPYCKRKKGFFTKLFRRNSYSNSKSY